MTEAVKPLLLLLNRIRSRRLYFRDCICQLQSQFKALVLLEYQARQQSGSRWARAGQVSGYYGVAMDTRGALVVSGQAMCQVTYRILVPLGTDTSHKTDYSTYIIIIIIIIIIAESTSKSTWFLFPTAIYYSSSL